MTDTNDYAQLGKVFDDLLHIAGRRREGIAVVVVPDLLHPMLIDNVNTVYLFFPQPSPARTSTQLVAELLAADAILSTHPAFDQDTGYEVFAASRVHGYRALMMLYDLLIQLGYTNVEDVAGDPRSDPSTAASTEHGADPFRES
jgi:hypothetical protein